MRGTDEAEEEKTEGWCVCVALVITLCSTSFTVRRNFTDRLSYSVQITDIHDRRRPVRAIFVSRFSCSNQGRIRVFIGSFMGESVGFERVDSKLAKKSKEWIGRYTSFAGGKTLNHPPDVPLRDRAN